MDSVDVIVVGAGAAGLATSTFAARAGAGRVVCLEGARRLGAKILVSGGGRCNVTNRQVEASDFNGGTPRFVRDVLRAFPADRAIGFFEAEGVRLHEEGHGKMFPDSGRARDVLDALVRAAERAGAEVRTGERVVAIETMADGFAVETRSGNRVGASAVVLATGGLSLPKSGSDGGGYALAQGLGHSLVEPVPALVPLLVAGDLCARLSGVSVPVELRVHGAGPAVMVSGDLLFTHFGVSGPAALDASRHWLVRPGARMTLSVCPGESFEQVEDWLVAAGARRGRALVSTVLTERLPQAVAEAWTSYAGLEEAATLSHLHRDTRRRLVHALTNMVLPITGSRGYNYAEVTAGGVPLSEVDPSSMESRRCSGLYLVGEVLDVDGRLGGFNFQWAWASGWVAGAALGRRRRLLLRPAPV
jgi:hypothetical protein